MKGGETGVRGVMTIGLTFTIRPEAKRGELARKRPLKPSKQMRESGLWKHLKALRRMK